MNIFYANSYLLKLSFTNDERTPDGKYQADLKRKAAINYFTSLGWKYCEKKKHQNQQYYLPESSTPENDLKVNNQVNDFCRKYTPSEVQLHYMRTILNTKDK